MHVEARMRDQEVRIGDGGRDGGRLNNNNNNNNDNNKIAFQLMMS